MTDINIVLFQKISIPLPQRDLKILKGWGVKDPGNSGEEGDWTVDLVFRWLIWSQKSFLTYQVDLSQVVINRYKRF